MAVPEEIQKQLLEEATSATPNYEIDYEDKKFQQVEEDKKNALDEINQTYAGMIGSTDKYFQDQINASKDWADNQTQIQNEQTDFAIEQIEQQKQQANKDYIKEQSGAYVDWQKQSNQYGTEAEKMASAGLTNTGFSESSQVSMYNTYQNRVATARESYNQAVLNYNNAIKDAKLQNSSVLAEIAYQSLQTQLELSLQGFQYKNQLIETLANKKMETENMYYQRYQDVLAQMNQENAMAEDIRQFNENIKFQTTQAELDRQFQAQEAELNRQFQEKEAELDRKFKQVQADLDRKHDLELLEVKDRYEREQLEIQHRNDMEKLKQQLANEKAILREKLANDKALLDYEYSKKKASFTGSSGGSSGGGSKKTTFQTITAASEKNQSSNILTNAPVNLQSVLNLGYGPINGTYLNSLVSSGKVTMYQKNGQTYFKKK